jgi:hypothetical protein
VCIIRVDATVNVRRLQLDIDKAVAAKWRVIQSSLDEVILG